LRSILKASVVGIVVAVLAFIPPILHFIGSTMVKATSYNAIRIGGCMGGLGVFASAAVLAVFFGDSFESLTGRAQILGVSLFVGLYTGLLGGLGAFIGAKVSSK
jgi:hypothetical protein